MLSKPFLEQSIVPDADVYNVVIYLYRNVTLTRDMLNLQLKVLWTASSL